MRSICDCTLNSGVGWIQHQRLAGQEQRPNQRLCRATDAVIQGTARSNILQGTRGWSVS